MDLHLIKQMTRRLRWGWNEDRIFIHNQKFNPQNLYFCDEEMEMNVGWWPLIYNLAEIIGWDPNPNECNPKSVFSRLCDAEAFLEIMEIQV